MKALLIYILFFNLLSQVTYSQTDSIYSRHIIQQLCSSSFHGRGYVKNGHLKAARFIAEEFRKNQLTPLYKSYYQSFPIEVNCFPKDISLKINGNTLETGIGFLPHPSSGAGRGSYTPILFREEDYRMPMRKLQSCRNQVLVFPPLKQEHSSISLRERSAIRQAILMQKEIPLGGCLLLQEEKLSFGLSQEKYSFPVFQVQWKYSLQKIEELCFGIKRKTCTTHGRNVLGMIRGSFVPDSFIVFMAHYDHLGQIGRSTYFPGANDNASGIAMLLRLAKHFSLNPPTYSILFVATAAEEAGLLGSFYLANHFPVPLTSVKFLLNIDLAGTGDEGIMVVNGSVYRKEFEILKSINEEKQLLPAVKIRGEACNSDHCPFHQKAVPSFFLYTLGGIQAYHDVYDRPETLPLTEFEDYVKLLVLFAENQMGHTRARL